MTILVPQQSLAPKLPGGLWWARIEASAALPHRITVEARAHAEHTKSGDGGFVETPDRRASGGSAQLAASFLAGQFVG